MDFLTSTGDFATNKASYVPGVGFTIELGGGPSGEQKHSIFRTFRAPAAIRRSIVDVEMSATLAGATSTSYYINGIAQYFGRQRPSPERPSR